MELSDLCLSSSTLLAYKFQVFSSLAVSSSGLEEITKKERQKAETRAFFRDFEIKFLRSLIV